jgi:hypothetical protein
MQWTQIEMVMVTVKFISIGREKNFTHIGGAKFIISATSRTEITESSISAMFRIRLSRDYKLSSAVSAYACLFFFPAYRYEFDCKAVLIQHSTQVMPHTAHWHIVPL